MRKVTACPIAASILFVACCSLEASSAAAATQRTFVASYGNDASPCSLALPCRSFASAIGKTNPDGEVIVLDSAGYGPVTITQSVTIAAPAGVYAGIFVPIGQTGVIVNGGGASVTLRGLTINGQGGGIGGIDFEQGQRLNIENCLVENINSYAVRAEASGSIVFVSDSTFRYNTIAGILLEQGTVTVDRSRFENNAHGVSVQPTSPSVVGVLIRDSIATGNFNDGVSAGVQNGNSARVVAERTTFSGNTYGLQVGAAVGGTLSVIVSDSTITDNTFSGIQASGGAGTVVDVTRSTVSRNGQFGLEQLGGVLATLQNNTLEQNVSGPTSGTIAPVTLK